jgi:hypothetical protein
MHKVIYLIVVCGVLLSGCNNLEKELKKQQDEVMGVHDEAMAQMDALHNYEVKFRTAVEQLKTDSLSDQSEINQKQELVYKLVKAQDAMMDWMHEYNPSEATAENPGAKDYLKSEMRKITDVHKQMFDALEASKVMN